jgi:hypothetical protein
MLPAVNAHVLTNPALISIELGSFPLVKVVTILDNIYSEVMNVLFTARKTYYTGPQKLDHEN